LKVLSFIKGWYSGRGARSSIILKNTLISFALKGISMLSNFVLVPLTIDYLNPTRYGIWLTISSIVGWMYLFDIGIGNGLRNKLAESLASNDKELSRKYISTSYLIIGIVSIALLLISVILIPLFNWARILNSSEVYAQELMTLTLLVFVFFWIQFTLRLVNMILLADLRTAQNDLIGVVSSVLSLIIIYIVTLYSNGSLLLLGIILSSTPVLVLGVATILLFNKRYKSIRPTYKAVDWNCSKSIMGLGVKFFILQISATIVYQSANIILIQLFGPNSVTEFNIAYKYFSIPLMLYIILIMPLWSAFTDAYAKNDMVWMRTTINTYKLFTVVFSVFVLLMLTISNFSYRIWVGDQIQVSFLLSMSMAIYVILFMWMSLYIYIINGIGKVQLQVYASIVEIIFNIPFSIFLGKIFGIKGVVFSMILFVLFRCIWAPMQLRRIINNSAQGIWNR
jgi:O-antigen/teichoic acid export membrane protein